MNVYLPDGSELVLDNGATVLDCAIAISRGLAKNALAGKVNDKVVDLNHILVEDDKVSLLTFNDAEGKEVFWHSSAHILAQAVQNIYPGTKISIGPSIESGFYYDFDTKEPFTPEDLVKIEKEIARIVSTKTPFVRSTMTKNEAEKAFLSKNETYKLELLADLDEDPTIYSQGDWFDMCRGPHVPNTGYIKAVKLLKLAGAYWRGDEKRPMLQRVYGVSFPKKKDLTEHLELLEEAKKRDHRKLGKELDLFSFHDEGLGFPFWHADGNVLYNQVADYSRREHIVRDYDEVRTPIILAEELWHKSGHWDKYQENMYFVDIEDKPHAIKPMNCPGGLLIYKDRPRSYRDFPIRNFEFGLVHRHEKKSAMHGLFRVRQFTQDDAHIFCTPEQIEPEIDDVIDFIFDVYKTMGFDDFFIELSTRPDKYIGSSEVWDKAENALQSVLENKKIDYQLNPGDGAFYGPKIDFHIKDSLKRSWQCGTIQLDFSMPNRFGLEYTDSDGKKKEPVMIHRALLGSMERFIGILIEHYAGFLPLWLSPQQVKVITITDKFLPYAEEVVKKLKRAGIRATLDTRSEKIGFKIRDAETKKTPYMAVIGEKEVDSNSVAVRLHKAGDIGTLTVDEFILKLTTQIDTKSGYEELS
jgi:threonyl-tRNA synthetase